MHNTKLCAFDWTLVVDCKLSQYLPFQQYMTRMWHVKVTCRFRIAISMVPEQSQNAINMLTILRSFKAVSAEMLPTAASFHNPPHDQAFCTLHRLSPLFNRPAQLSSPGVYLGIQGLQAKCSHARTSPYLKYRRSCAHRVAAMSAAHAHVEPSTQSVEVAIITTVGCQFCKRAKETLKQAGLEYREIEASNQPELLNKIKETTGRRTVPQVSQCPQY